MKEASKDIFNHLLGFDLPEQIRETLRLFLTKTRVYHKNTDIEAVVNTIRGDAVQLTLSVRSEIVAIAKTTYHQHFACEESEHGKILQATITSALHPEMDVSHDNPSLTQVMNEPSVFEWNGDEVTLKRGESLNYFLRYTVERPKNDFFTYNFGSPTIYPVLRISCGDDLSVTASVPEQTIGNQYIYMKVFLVGDHIQVRWRSNTREN